MAGQPAADPRSAGAEPPAARITVGAAFLMATSAIGPGFLTQTAVFTGALRADFAFAILVSVLVDLAVQVNVWRVLGVARLRGQELASRLLPGLGTVIALLVAGGGLAFNVGNLAGCGLGLVIFGLPVAAGASLSALLALGLLASPRAGRAMDLFSQSLGGLMILLTVAVMLSSRPDYLAALRAAFLPGRVAFLPIVTLMGGTVGGYITFSGVHRLLDAGIGGPGDVPHLTRAAGLGIGITALMRVVLFLAVLGVVGSAGTLDPANPAASAFRQGAGEWGYRFFGIVLWSAAITSVVGCSYTSLSFLRTTMARVERWPTRALGLFIAISLAVFLLLGQPVRVLVFVGALNGLILPVTLVVVLIAAARPALLNGYRHPPLLQAVGWAALLVTLVAAGLALGDLARL
jgi:Mn2+/Fe2+ NRAMP family transporter